MPEARYRNPPPRFPPEQKKPDAASELESSEEEKAHSSGEEDEDQCERVHQVTQLICVMLADQLHRHSV